ncbi:heavy metal translocating P-type ATPase [Pseudomonas sp. Pseu.R1]|uniref:heavy metal translocating P-type ATPase n=1 Tax=Pseudomonas sp. Pseu.R1 TaxID=3379818 RepID=UPI003B94EBFC
MSDSVHKHSPHDHAGHDHAGHSHAGHGHAHQDHAAPVKFTPAGKHDHKAHSCCSHEVAPAVVSIGSGSTDNARLSSFRIEAMDCPTEQTLIQNKLGKMAGVQKLEFNLINRVLGVWHELPSTDPIRAAIGSLGMQADVINEGVEAEVSKPTAKKPWWPLALSGVAAVAAEVIHFTDAAPTWVVALIALVAIFSGGLTTYKKGWIALKNFNLNINALMSIAVTGAVLIGQWPEAAMVMFLFTVAELIEAKSLDRARNAISGLMQLTPDMATVQQGGQWVEVEVKQIALGSVVRVKPGERIGLDGEVVSGHSSIDQAPITGESLPVEKTVGDKVFAGTINQAGSLEYKVTAAANNSTLARIIHAVEAAQGARAPTQRFVDSFSKIYTPAVFALALAVAIIPPLFMGAAWFDWIYRALVLLVVACPCALVISTPVSIVSGLAAAARKGILVKGGVYLEMGHQLDYLALDKTGTITHGKPMQTDYVLLDEAFGERALTISASLAGRSDHPVSQAIATHFGKDGHLSVEAFEALSGLGVKGDVEGRLYHLGNHRLVHESGLCSPELEARLEALESQGKTVVLLFDETGPLALFAVADTVKDSSREAIAQLHALGVKTVMLTGDNPHTAKAIAAQVGIDQAQGNLLPTDKLQAIEGLYAQKHRAGMVGDGINDAPALARAEIGFAMAAAGTDTAIETADVALMDDDLRKIPAFIRLSRDTAAVLKQNIALALVIKAIFLAVTFAGVATMWMAVFADMGVSLLVVFNGLRLLRK